MSVQITAKAEDLQRRAEAESARLKRVRAERETEDRGFAAAVQVGGKGCRLIKRVKGPRILRVDLIS